MGAVLYDIEEDWEQGDLARVRLDRLIRGTPFFQTRVSDESFGLVLCRVPAPRPRQDSLFGEKDDDLPTLGHLHYARKKLVPGGSTLLDAQEILALQASSPLWEAFRKGVARRDDSRRELPPLPLRQGHVALQLATGRLDGVVGQGEHRHAVKGRVIRRMGDPIETELEDGRVETVAGETLAIEITALDRGGRLEYLMLHAFHEDPDLYHCANFEKGLERFVQAACQAAIVGLEPGRALDLAYISAKKDTGRVIGAEFHTTYKGDLQVLYRAKSTRKIYAEVVHEKDEFDMTLGIEPVIRHKSYLKGDPGEIIGAYSVAKLANGEVQVVHAARRDRSSPVQVPTQTRWKSMARMVRGNGKEVSPPASHEAASAHPRNSGARGAGRELGILASGGDGGRR